MEGEKKSSAISNVGAWAMNVISSVGIIMANKQLMSVNGYAFSFATTLTGFHFAVTALVGLVSNATGYSASKHVPLWELVWFSLVANASITGMNLSLMLNSVGFYQVSPGKRDSVKEVIMVDPLEAKRLAAKQMAEIKAKQKLKRRRQIEAINGAWAMIGLTAGLVIEGQTGNGILSQIVVLVALRRLGRNYIHESSLKLKKKLGAGAASKSIE